MEKLTSLVIGISIASLGIMASYILFQKKKPKKAKNDYCKEIQVPNQCVPYVLGKYGCVVRTLQDRFLITLYFRSPGLFNDETTCIIKGNPEHVKLAELVIKNIILNYEQLSQKTGKIDTNANLYNLSTNYTEEGAKIFSEILNVVTTSKSNEVTPDTNLSYEKEDQNTVLQYDKVANISSYREHIQKLQSVGGDNLIPVYVSAVATPEQFWVQPTKTKEHAELDQMTVELYDFYDFNQDWNIPPEYDTIKVGNLYATYFEEDNRWYRAEVCDISPKNEENPLNTTLDLFFVDYGESSYQKMKNLRIIPEHLLELKFQAVLCSLANVKSKEKLWSEKAISYFEELTRSAQWYTLKARVEYDIEKDFSTNPIPCLTLIDANSDDVNVNEEMVNAGFAEYIS